MKLPLREPAPERPHQPRRPSTVLSLPPDEDQELWLISYADMMTLLFAVFVLVVAIVGLAPPAPRQPPPPAAVGATSILPGIGIGIAAPFDPPPQALPAPRDSASPDAEQNAQATGMKPAAPTPPAAVPAPRPAAADAADAAHGDQAGVAAGTPSPAPGASATVLAPGQVVADGPDLMRRRWQDYLQRAGLQGSVDVTVDGSTIELVLREQVLFASGQVEVHADGRSVLQRLAAVLDTMPGHITVEGHTDDVPMRGGRFTSNWALSGVRAAAVAETLMDAGLPATRLRIVGYADTRPVADNATAEGRAANRRVVLSLNP